MNESIWLNKKPLKSGLYFRSNPAIQKDVTMQEVFDIDGTLKTVHPHNEEGRLIDIKDMPNSFFWIKIPYPPQVKRNAGKV